MSQENKKQTEQSKSPIVWLIDLVVIIVGGYASMQQYGNSKNLYRAFLFMIFAILITFFVHFFLTKGSQKLKRFLGNLFAVFVFLVFIVLVGKSISPSVPPFNLIEVNPIGNLFNEEEVTPEDTTSTNLPLNGNLTLINGKITCEGIVDEALIVLLSPKHLELSKEIDGSFSFSQPKNESKNIQQYVFEVSKKEHVSIEIKKEIKEGATNDISFNVCLEKENIENRKNKFLIKGKFRVRFMDEYKGQVSFKNSNSMERLISDLDLSNNDNMFEREIFLPEGDSLIIFCHLIDPKSGYAAFGNPIKIGGSNLEIDFRFEKIADIYIKDIEHAKRESENGFPSSAAKTLGLLLRNSIYESRTQKYEILINKARYESKAKKYDASLNTFMEIFSDSLFNFLDKNQILNYWGERFDALMNFYEEVETDKLVLKITQDNTRKYWNAFVREFSSSYESQNKSFIDMAEKKQIQYIKKFTGRP